MKRNQNLVVPSDEDLEELGWEIVRAHLFAVRHLLQGLHKLLGVLAQSMA